MKNLYRTEGRAVQVEQENSVQTVNALSMAEHTYLNGPLETGMKCVSVQVNRSRQEWFFGANGAAVWRAGLPARLLRQLPEFDLRGRASDNVQHYSAVYIRPHEQEIIHPQLP
jgi:hypothetical protein